MLLPFPKNVTSLSSDLSPGDVNSGVVTHPSGHSQIRKLSYKVPRSPPCVFPLKQWMLRSGGNEEAVKLTCVLALLRAMCAHTRPGRQACVVTTTPVSVASYAVAAAVLKPSTNPTTPSHVSSAPTSTSGDQDSLPGERIDVFIPKYLLCIY